MFSSFKSAAFWVFIAICLVMLWALVQTNLNTDREAEYSYSDLVNKVQSGEVLVAVIQSNELKGHLKATPKDEFHTTLPPNYDDLLRAMLAAKVDFTIKPEPRSLLVVLLSNLGPIGLVLLLIVPAFWMIFKKAGFQPVLSVLMLVPLVNFVLLYIIAFTEWKFGPAQKA